MQVGIQEDFELIRVLRLWGKVEHAASLFLQTPTDAFGLRRLA